MDDSSTNISPRTRLEAGPPDRCNPSVVRGRWRWAGPTDTAPDTLRLMQRTIAYQPGEVPVAEPYDVVVCGGGPSEPRWPLHETG